MPALTRRQILAGAASTAAVAAMPAAAIGAPETAPVMMKSGSAVLRYGNFDPESFGVDGDTYIDIITDNVWQKTAGAWRMVANIKEITSAGG
jgi:hypothetical protein